MEHQEIINWTIVGILFIQSMVIGVLVIKQKGINISLDTITYYLWKSVPVIVFILILVTVFLLAIATIQDPHIWDVFNL